MTSYQVITQNTSGGMLFTIKANTHAVRIAFLDYSAIASGTFSNVGGTWTRYTSASISGGSAVVPALFRDGGPPASATVNRDGTVSGSSSAPFQANSDLIRTDFQFTLNPGDALGIVPTPGSTIASTAVILTFEELGLALSV